MRVHILQHVPFEGLGSIELWLFEHGANVTFTRFYESSNLPTLDEIDMVIVLGGPMSVNDESVLSWLVAEKMFIAEAIRSDKAVLGICLGAQLIANALGSKVYSNKIKEIGWFPVYASERIFGSFQFPSEALVFHWHGETFDLPAEARLLASSTGCKNQAFQIKQNVIGLQFHLETTPHSATAIIEACGEELIPSAFIQTADTLRSAPTSNYEQANQLMAKVLSYLREE
jgi:GMP synthase-like glutamine amidotransferase